MRLIFRDNRINNGSFNPRICKRCDNIFQGHADRCQVSIHASVKDATNNAVIVSINSPVSIHASVKDATEAMIHRLGTLQVSIHASVKDATLISSSF